MLLVDRVGDPLCSWLQTGGIYSWFQQFETAHGR